VIHGVWLCVTTIRLNDVKCRVVLDAKCNHGQGSRANETHTISFTGLYVDDGQLTGALASFLAPCNTDAIDQHCIYLAGPGERCSRETVLDCVVTLVEVVLQKDNALFIVLEWRWTKVIDDQRPSRGNGLESDV
jgi:hypothetical protein